MKYIVAIDSFKGCITSIEANQAAAEGILNKVSDSDVVQIPVSDGGEGWLEAFKNALGGHHWTSLCRGCWMGEVGMRGARCLLGRASGRTP